MRQTTHAQMNLFTNYNHHNLAYTLLPFRYVTIFKADQMQRLREV